LRNSVKGELLPIYKRNNESCATTKGLPKTKKNTCKEGGAGVRKGVGGISVYNWKKNLKKLKGRRITQQTKDLGDLSNNTEEKAGAFWPRKGAHFNGNRKQGRGGSKGLETENLFGVQKKRNKPSIKSTIHSK